MISFVVYGKPQPAGSKRAFNHPTTGRIVVTDDAKHSRSWKQEIASVARADAGPGGLLEGPLKLSVLFVVARPAGHFGTGRNAGKVRASAPQYPAVRPDVTKLLRAVEDALTGIVWRDDAQVVEQTAWKLYGDPERCDITIERLDAEAAA